MSEQSFLSKRPTRASFKGGRANHDIFDSQGVKWIAKGQFLTEKQIEIALEKGSLTRANFQASNLAPKTSTTFELKPTFSEIVELTNNIELVDQAKTEDLNHDGKLSDKTQQLVSKSGDAILDLIESNQFSPYKLTGLTSFLYGEDSYKSKRSFLKTLNNAGTQHTLFKGIINEGLKDLVKVNLLNPFGTLEEIAKQQALDTQLGKSDYRALCQTVSDTLTTAISGNTLETPFLKDLLRYFSPHLYFTSPELRLFQQVNQYVNFAMPDDVQESLPFEKSNIPVINLAQYFKQPDKGGGLGIEGARIVQYVGLIPSGTAVQFTNREKGIVIAPKSKDILYCAVITGMDGQPMLTPSLRELQFRDLGKQFEIIRSSELPLKYEEHSHEKIWKMHIVHEKLKKLGE